MVDLEPSPIIQDPSSASASLRDEPPALSPAYEENPIINQLQTILVARPLQSLDAASRAQLKEEAFQLGAKLANVLLEMYPQCIRGTTECVAAIEAECAAIDELKIGTSETPLVLDVTRILKLPGIEPLPRELWNNRTTMIRELALMWLKFLVFARFRIPDRDKLRELPDSQLEAILGGDFSKAESIRLTRCMWTPLLRPLIEENLSDGVTSVLYPQQTAAADEVTSSISAEGLSTQHGAHEDAYDDGVGPRPGGNEDVDPFLYRQNRRNETETVEEAVARAERLRQRYEGVVGEQYAGSAPEGSLLAMHLEEMKKKQETEATQSGSQDSSGGPALYRMDYEELMGTATRSRQGPKSSLTLGNIAGDGTNQLPFMFTTGK